MFTSSVAAATPNTEARTFYYLSDHLGTVQLLVDQEQTLVWKGEFKPFGQVTQVINELDNNFRFPGQYFDEESGLHQNWHRYYDPMVGRYVSADPIGLDGGINLYGYVNGNHVNALDPKGLYIFGQDGDWYEPGGGHDGVTWIDFSIDVGTAFMIYSYFNPYCYWDNCEGGFQDCIYYFEKDLEKCRSKYSSNDNVLTRCINSEKGMFRKCMKNNSLKFQCLCD